MFRTPYTFFTKSQKTHDFVHFWPFSWVIAHGSGSAGDKNGPGPVTRFSRNHRKLVISDISDRFRVLQHTVLGYDVDLNGPGPVTRFSRNHKKLVISSIYGRFRVLQHTVLESRVDLNDPVPVTRVSENRKKLVISAITSRFRGLQHTILGSDRI